MNRDIEINSRRPIDLQVELPSGAMLLVTAEAEHCWLFRLQVSADTMVLAVPRFGGVDIEIRSAGRVILAVPYEVAAAEIVKGAGSDVPRAALKKAIQDIQRKVTEWRFCSEAKG